MGGAGGRQQSARRRQGGEARRSLLASSGVRRTVGGLLLSLTRSTAPPTRPLSTCAGQGCLTCACRALRERPGSWTSTPPSVSSLRLLIFPRRRLRPQTSPSARGSDGFRCFLSSPLEEPCVLRHRAAAEVGQGARAPRPLRRLPQSATSQHFHCSRCYPSLGAAVLVLGGYIGPARPPPRC